MEISFYFTSYRINWCCDYYLCLNRFVSNQFYELNSIYIKIYKEYETVNKLVSLKDLEVNRAMISDNGYNGIMKVLNKSSE